MLYLIKQNDTVTLPFKYKYSNKKEGKENLREEPTMQ